MTQSSASSFKKCNRKQSDFNECLTSAVEDAIRQLTQPIKEVNLPNLEPLEVPSLIIGAGHGAVAFSQNYKNLQVSGFSKTECSKFDMNFESKVVTMECQAPQIRMEFQYEINGKILLLPIYGKGPGTITLDNIKEVLTFNLEEYEKKNKKFFKVVGSKLVMEPGLIHFQLDNLFDGDKVLGENILKVLNENWKEVYGDVQSSYEHAFGQIFTSIFSNLLAKVPVSELFGEE
ncbi:takeout-like [Asbolus verrucosus]|uniref:Takeout-like n=1 Tax=Asbolus verrucosus TaxID=1661398 RepID=A0A482VP79_ASBVE|nr:takeout-like [Asbolus verrucosus]